MIEITDMTFSVDCYNCTTFTASLSSMMTFILWRPYIVLTVFRYRKKLLLMTQRRYLGHRLAAVKFWAVFLVCMLSDRNDSNIIGGFS